MPSLGSLTIQRITLLLTFLKMSSLRDNANTVNASLTLLAAVCPILHRRLTISSSSSLVFSDLQPSGLADSESGSGGGRDRADSGEM